MASAVYTAKKGTHTHHQTPSMLLYCLDDTQRESFD